MGVNNTKLEQRLQALCDVANAHGVTVIEAVSKLYDVMNMRWPDRKDAKRNADLLVAAQTALRSWLEAITSNGGNLGSVIAEVGDALEDASCKDVGLGYYYDKDARRFERIVLDLTAPPHALVALAALPLFDEREGVRGRLHRCEYRNCKAPYYLAPGKANTQEHYYCSPAHGNTERQYRHRGKST